MWDLLKFSRDDKLLMSRRVGGMKLKLDWALDGT
jgi:hypothetical protein